LVAIGTPFRNASRRASPFDTKRVTFIAGSKFVPRAYGYVCAYGAGIASGHDPITPLGWLKLALFALFRYERVV
jgi:hypothetical protein